MKVSIAPVAPLLLSVALLLMGNGLQGTLLPVRAGLEAFSAVEIGIMGSVYFLGFALGCFYGPHLVRRVGHIRTFAGVVAVASCVALGHAIVLEPLVWWVLRGITGACFAVLYIVIESWLNDKASNESRGFVFSLYTAINLAMMTAGQMLLVVDQPESFRLFAIASILVSIAAVPVALTTAEAPAPVSSIRLDIRGLLHVSPVGFVGCFVVGLANGAFWALAPTFVQASGGSTTRIALFMSIAVICGAIAQWPLGLASDRMDRRLVIASSAALAALAGIGLGLLSGYGLGWLYAFGGLFGFAALPIYPLAVAHANDFVEKSELVGTASSLLLVFAAGAVIGPVLASAVMGLTSPVSLFLYTAFVHVGLLAFTLYRMRRRAPVAESERAAFMDSIRAGQTVSTVDTLSEQEAAGTVAER